MAEERCTTSNTGLTWIFQEMFRLMHNQEQDNFDNFRYPEEHRGSFFYDVHARYLGFLIENADRFHVARSLFEDRESRELFDKLILFRLLGHFHVRLPVDNRELLQRRELPREWKIDDTGDVGMFGPLSIFSVPYKGAEIWVKGGPSNVAASFLSGQYYFDRSITMRKRSSMEQRLRIESLSGAQI